VTAEDFGHGFDLTAARGNGFGLIGIRERVRLAGGGFRVDSASGTGTRIVVELPIPAASPPDGQRALACGQRGDS
jgi:signal transduction histidine kinase